MAIRHSDHPTWGVQFHPESIGTPMGTTIISNFVALAAEANRDTPSATTGYDIF